jgi:hypothetical protein
MLVSLARAHHWTPEQVGRMDPDFLEELSACMQAEAKIQKQEADKRRRRGGG